MNVFILCIFALVPFHNASVHEAKLTVCPDFAQVLRFENEIRSYKIPAESAAPEEETASVPETASTLESVLEQETASAPETVSDPIPVGHLEPEIVPELSPKPEQQITELKKAEEPATLEIPEQLVPPPPSSSGKVEFAAAEEPIGTVSQTPVESKTADSVPSDVPIRRPWGILTFFIFLLLLSVSANVFLGWQLIETRMAKIK
ncbi:MAG: hypothetical protein Q4A17_06910 [Thermoguttaceae bacterium]|nr:hypothetical protein [Thermoguttaceae bacterium]